MAHLHPGLMVGPACQCVFSWLCLCTGRVVATTGQDAFQQGYDWAAHMPCQAIYQDFARL